MRIAITIIVIIGVLTSMGLGLYWVNDYNDYKSQIEEISSTADDLGVDVKDELNALEKIKNCGYVLAVGGILSLIAVILIGKLKKISAIVFLLAAIVPAILTPASLLGTFMLIVGGILALFYKPKAQAAETTAA